VNAQISRAKELGLCFGVRRAVKMLKEAAKKYGEIETLGPVAHNRQLVLALAEMGIRPVENLEQLEGKVLAITTHGASPDVLSETQSRHVHVIDTTCPIVKRAQNSAKELAENGFDVIVFGEAGHSEVKGLLGWSGAKGIVALDGTEIDSSKLSHRIGVISQTTQSQSAFVEFTRKLMVALFPTVQEMRIINTLCRATQRRQQAAVTLAKRSQLMIVVGGYDSANTRRLAEACSPIVETHLLERADRVDGSWLVGKQRIGIAAGASTPDEAVEELADKLTSLAKLIA
jgi:4-hydroxy-3-methylbut-2-enyl diphosphate reductase